MLKAVIFDMDGVLVDTMPYHRKMNTELAEAIGCIYDEDMHNRLKGLPRRDILIDMIESAGKEANDDLIQTYSRFKDERFGDFLKTVDDRLIHNGILPLLTRLREKGIKIGVASGSSNAKIILDSSGLSTYVDYVADIHILKKGKPDPEIFQQVLDYFHIEASESIGFEDGAPGIEGFKELGIFSVGIGDLDELKDADLIVSDASEITYDHLMTEYNKWQNK